MNTVRRGVKHRIRSVGTIDRWVAVALVSSLAGCESQFLDPKLELIPKAVPQAFDDGDWATVLRENVKGGRVDYTHLAGHRAALDRFVALISVVGPATTPNLFVSNNAKLAYWINAYNALVLYAVLDVYPASTMYDLALPRLEQDVHFRVDGATGTLRQIRARADDASGNNPYILFTLCGAARGSPPLSEQPYRAETLDAQLTRHVRRAIENNNLVRVDHEGMRLLLSVDILAARQRLIAHQMRQTGARGATILSVLLSVAPSPQRRRLLNRAVGYRLGTIPFDRRLNNWAPAQPGTDGTTTPGARAP